ncbi:MAG: sodium:alanine symporter family protein, partial [Chlamydiae bacterium]|nr:sodium:alanine symporter family protein [Chlamydiota bacterium]
MLSIITDTILFFACLVVLAASIYLSIKLRFVQLRFIPNLLKTFVLSLTGKHEKTSHTIAPHRALFTAMSTTLGISTIVGPAIAIRLGGPGALVGFLLTSFFG